MTLEDQQTQTHSTDGDFPQGVALNEDSQIVSPEPDPLAERKAVVQTTLAEGGDIETVRTMYAEEKERLYSGKESVLAEKESYERNLERLRGEMESLRSEVESKRASILSRILEWKRIREIQQELARDTHAEESYTEGIQEKEKILKKFDELLSLEDAYEVYVDGLAQQKEQEAHEMMEEERQRDIDYLIKKHNVYVMHEFITGENTPFEDNESVNTRGLTVEDYLDIDLSIKPPISTSTIHPGTQESLFSHYNKTEGQESGFGILLSGGRAQGGYHEDAWSVAKNRNERSMPEEMQTLESVNKAISKVNTYDTDTGYNEVVVQSPEIAGVFFNWLEGEGNKDVLKENVENTLLDGNGTRYGGWWERIANIQKRNTPIFVLDRKDNTVRQVYDIDGEKRTFKVTPVWTPDMFVNMPGIYKQHIDPEEKKRAIGRVYDHVSGILTEEEEKTAVRDGREHERAWTYGNTS
ncbi:MAG: hypothetical protein HGB03_03485 [Candidatus Yonathbacteria bacterium]|nr:hypothetical protein [Candidatus Yonathbacteria bacterium]